MAIIGSMDLGLGDAAENAYVRIKDAVYSTTTPEWEIEVHCYYNKAARKLEILKKFVSEYFYDQGNIDFLSEENKQWLAENINGRSVRPLITMKFATKNIEGFPTTTDQKEVLTFFYNFIKQYHVMGGIQNPQDDLDTTTQVIKDFTEAHPELFKTA
jgi:hypothetical protein